MMKYRNAISESTSSYAPKIIFIICLLLAQSIALFAHESRSDEQLFIKSLDRSVKSDSKIRKTFSTKKTTPVVSHALTLPVNYVFDGKINEWESITPTFVLIKNKTTSRDGVIWIGQSEQELIVAGKINGEKPRWPKAPGEIAVGDHVELWISDGYELTLPPVGWGNQFGFETLATPEDCNQLDSDGRHKTKDDAVNECKSWYMAQLDYRRTFEKLFVRQWQIAPNIIAETHALPAFSSFDKALRKELQLLEPLGSPQIQFFKPVDKDTAYTFEILLPWSAFPPMKPLQLADVKIMVDVFNPGPADGTYSSFSTTSGRREYGRPETFNTVKLKPINYYLTSCKFNTPSIDEISEFSRVPVSESAALYFLPKNDRTIGTLLLLENTAQGYQYNPSPDSHSPIVYKLNFFALQLNAHETLCGPQLSYTRDGKIYRSKHVIETWASLETRKNSNGTLFIKDGPRVYSSRFGTGQCGACPRVLLNIFSIKPRTGEIKHIFNLEKIVETGVDDMDIHVSDNWETVNIFETHLPIDNENNLEKRHWSSIKNCYSKANNEYRICGKRINTLPPTSRVLKLEQ